MFLLQTVSLQNKHNLVSSYGNETVFFYLHLTILFFSLAATTIVLYSLILGIVKTKHEKKLNTLRQRYALFFAEWVLQEPNYEQKDTPNTQSLLLTDQDTTDPFCRNVLKEQILLLHKNILGNEAQRLVDYYKALGFPSVAYKNLNSKSQYTIIKALNELQQMNICESYAKVAPLMQHKNTNIATAAFCTALHLSLSDTIETLHQTKWTLTDWQQHLIHHSLSQLPNNKLPNFEQWLRHPSETVVLFALRMMNAFNQTCLPEQLLDLLHTTQNVYIQIALVKNLCRLGKPNIVPLLIHFYRNHQDTSPQICLEIIKELQWLPFANTIHFLQTELLTNNIVLQKTVANTLACISRQSLINLQNNLDSQNIVLHQIISAALYQSKAA